MARPLVSPATGTLQLSARVVERLSLYRRALRDAGLAVRGSVYSHQLAAACGVTAVQVRRDLMALETSGSPSSGYSVERLLADIDALLDTPYCRPVALVGIGHLGRAVLGYLEDRRPRFAWVAAFDRDIRKTDRVLSGVHTYPMEQFPAVVADLGIQVGIVAVPAPEAASVARTMVKAGILGILNFAPAHLSVPKHVAVESIDLEVVLEKVAFLADRAGREAGTRLAAAHRSPGTDIQDRWAKPWR